MGSDVCYRMICSVIWVCLQDGKLQCPTEVERSRQRGRQEVAVPSRKDVVKEAACNCFLLLPECDLIGKALRSRVSNT